MKKFLIILIFLLILPLAHAHGLYVREHNITYYLNEENFYVEETIVFSNYGDPFTFEGKVILDRGDAKEISVRGSKFEVKYEPTAKIYIELFVNKGTTQTINLKYRRSDMLLNKEGILVFKGLALGKYYWDVHKINIKFITPDDYYFGKILPKATPVREGNKELLSYSTTIFDNITAIEEGFPVEIEYAKYKELAIGELRAAQERISEAEYNIEDANTTIEKAKEFGANLTKALKAFDSSIKNLELAKKKLKLSQISLNSYKNYYLSYNFASSSRTHAIIASREAREAKNLASFEIQASLEQKISNISKTTAKPTIIVHTYKQVEKKKIDWYSIAGILFASLLVLFATLRFRERRREERARVGVANYQNIGELKYKRFEGFEKKVDTVKKGESIAVEIMKLRRERDKYELGIENLKKKMLAGEITKKEYDKKKQEFEKKIENINSKILKLEEKLREIRLVKK